MAAEVKVAKKKKTNGYKLPDPIPPGEILTDIKKNQWILDKSIGVGGFGEVYSAAPYTGKPPKDFPNVIKIEPHDNGPLFVEMHFYMRNAKLDEINAWMKQKNLSGLGMPPYISSGSHQHKNTKYRFVVMNRYGMDLWKLFEKNNRRFPEHTVYKLALQIVNVLEYIHSKKYVHADVKGSNLLLDLKSPDQVYLVDFGLASRYTIKDVCERDARKAHNGTIEYTSRDAHIGVPTMRGDLEILGYNIIQWLCSYLLWEKDLSDVVKVHNQKEAAFENIPEFLKKSFKESVPSPVLKYMSQLAGMKFNDVPDYDKFKKILTEGLKQLSHKPDGKLEFKSSDPEVLKSTPKKVKKPVKNRKNPDKRTKAVLNDDESDEESTKKAVKTTVRSRKNSAKRMKEVLDDNESDEESDKKLKTTKNRKSPGRRIKEVLNNDDSDEESYKTTAKTTVRSRKNPAKRMKEALNDDESDEESNKKINTVENRKSPGRRIKEVLNNGVSDEESNKTTVKTTVRSRKNPATRMKEVMNDDESDEESNKKIKTPAKIRKSPGTRTKEVLNDDESDEEFYKKAGKTTPKSRKNPIRSTKEVLYNYESDEDMFKDDS